MNLRTRFKQRPPLLSNYIRQRRYAIAARHIAGSVLDIGCGEAYLLDRMPQLGDYVGLDSHPAFLEYAQKQHPAATFYPLDAEDQGFPPEVVARRFDTIVILALLEHLAEPQHILRQASQVLRPGGKLIATTPTPFGHRVHELGARLGLFYHEAAADHKSMLGRRALEELFGRAGLRVLEYRQFEFGCNQAIVGGLA